MGAKPNIAVGNHGTVTEVLAMNGAAMEPILIAVEQAPIAMFLITVGYNSEV